MVEVVHAFAGKVAPDGRCACALRNMTEDEIGEQARQIIHGLGARSVERAIRMLEEVTEPPREPHESPGESCTCGVYALKYLRDDQPYHLGAPVFGTVTCWGKVIEGDNGARAQFAYPSELYVTSHRLEEQLQDYGVPIVVRPHGWWDRHQMLPLAS
jgi:hypothetical protein